MRRMMALALVTALLGLSASAAMLPMEPVAAGGGDIVATAKWDTPDADVDLVIVGPDNQTFKAAQDFLSGPATELATVRNPVPGEYKVGVIWQNDKPNMQVAVTVEVKQGDRLIGTFPVILAAGNPNDRKIVTSVNVGAGPGPGPGPIQPVQPGPATGGGDLAVTMKWQTQGTDVDLVVIGPNNQPFKAMNDVISGPGEETVVVRNPGAGDYKVAVFYADSKGGQQTPVTVEVKLGGRQVGTYQAVVQKDKDIQFVTTVTVGAGAGPGPFGPGPIGPRPITPTPGKDPLGFAGKWTEYWPGVNVHDVSEITFDNGQYQVKVSNPQAGPYRVDNVRVEGNVLKFTEYPGGNTIHYEVRLQDANTCAVTVQGGPDAAGGILWKRDTTSGLVTPAGGGGDLVATLKWETQGTDVDLAVLGPNNQSYTAARDITSGPGQEVCTVRNPVPGDYKIIGIYANSKGGTQTPVAAEVKIGDRVVANKTDVLARDGEVKLIATVTVAGAVVGPGEKDPLGFVGTWVEDWPGVRDHDISAITFQNGQYNIQVSNPKSGPYRVDNVRLEGNVLKFTEYPGGNTIHYSVTLQDPNTCAVQVQGGPAPRGAIVWRRQGTTPPGF